MVKESHGREILSTRALGKDNIKKVHTELGCDRVKRTAMFQDRTQGHAMGQVHKRRLLWKVLSAAQFAVTQSNAADPPYRPFVSQVLLTDEASPAVLTAMLIVTTASQSGAYNSHINCSGRARLPTFLFLRQTPLKTTSVLTSHNSFLSHKLKTLGRKKRKEKVYLFSNRKKAPPISVATVDMS